MGHAILERRSAERFHTKLTGHIVGPDAPSIDCVLLNISKTGARITVPQPAEIPLEFQLQIPEEEASAKVRLIWSSGIDYGVMFTD